MHQRTHTIGNWKCINELGVLVDVFLHMKGKFVRHLEKKIIRKTEPRQVPPGKLKNAANVSTARIDSDTVTED